MARSSTTYEPGQSGNPNGRPPKSRALTAILERRGNSTYLDVDGRNHGGKYIVARAVWELAATGRTTLQNSEKIVELKVGPRGWFEIVKWLYSQIDGPPVKRNEITGSDGGPIILKWPEDSD